MSKPVAFAVAAHPDDIEFMMGGTLLLLGKAGYDLHYMNIANGSMGTAIYSREEIIAMRTGEARRAAKTLGATFHEPLVDDLDIYYDRELPGACAPLSGRLNRGSCCCSPPRITWKTTPMRAGWPYPPRFSAACATSSRTRRSRPSRTR